MVWEFLVECRHHVFKIRLITDHLVCGRKLELDTQFGEMFLKLTCDDIAEGHLARANFSTHHLILSGNTRRSAANVLFLYKRSKLFALSHCRNQ